MDAVIERIKKTEHVEAIETMCDYFILPNKKKPNTVWIYGSANSGKTNLLRIIKEIFTCAVYK